MQEQDCCTNIVHSRTMPISDTIAKYLMDSMSTAILLFDENKEVSTMNIASEHLLSVSCRQVKGMKISELLPNNPSLHQIIEKSVTQGNTITEYEISINLPSMTSITVDCSVSPIQVPNDGNGILMELVNSDSLSRITRKQNLVQQQSTAKESTRSMAHEIKNPLGGIRGAAQLLEQELQNESLREYTQIIINEADRLRNLVDRMMTPHSRVERQNVNIHEILEYVSNLIEAEADKPFELIKDYDPSLPELYADREQLIQAMINILRNAVQAIPDHGNIIVQTRIQYQANIVDKTWNLALKISIQDNGPGIPPEIKDSLFFPMITGRAEGTGLGLSIAQSLIQNHGGLIEYQRKNNLTEFSILLPLDKT